MVISDYTVEFMYSKYANLKMHRVLTTHIFSSLCYVLSAWHKQII
jgi:hypothetical protein